jgi:hypothetical protein
MPSSDLRRIFDAAEELGFDEPELRSGGHYATTHPTSGTTVFFPATPSDNRGVDNAISKLQNAAGKRLSKQRGYSGGKRIPRRPTTDLHTRTLSEQRSAALRTQYAARIAELDADIRDLVERIDLGRCKANAYTLGHLEGLLDARADYANRLRAHLGVVPELDIDGLDVLVSTASDDTPATDADLDQLRAKYSA